MIVKSSQWYSWSIRNGEKMLVKLVEKWKMAKGHLVTW